MFRKYIALFGLFAFFLTGAFSPQTASAQLGFAVGGNFNDLSDIDSDPPTTFDNATGFHVGVFYDLGVGPVALRPGLFYMDAGDFDANGDGFEAQSFDLQFIEVPVDVRFNVLTAPIVRPYVTHSTNSATPPMSASALKSALLSVASRSIQRSAMPLASPASRMTTSFWGLASPPTRTSNSTPSCCAWVYRSNRV